MEAAIVIGLLIIAVILFASEKISVDLVTLAMLCALVLCGVITVNEAFAGFGHDVIVMLGAIFVIGAALRETGVLDSVGHVLARTTGGHPKRIIAGMMTTVGGISAFMNNTTVTAMFLGPVIGAPSSAPPPTCWWTTWPALRGRRPSRFSRLRLLGWPLPWLAGSI